MATREDTRWGGRGRSRTARLLRAGAGLLLVHLAPGAALAQPTAGSSDTPLQPTITIGVDDRVELIGILFRMGGRREYDMTVVPEWARAIDEHFAAHVDHPAVSMATRLAGTYDIGFFVPMNLAVHVNAPPGLEERGDLAASSSIHDTWTVFPDSTRAFLQLAREFAVDAEFDRFMGDNRSIVETTETRLRRLVEERVDLGWFGRFWGFEPRAEFTLVPGLLNGRASYGVEYERPGGGRELYAIVGVSDVDEAGLPVFDASFARTVVHEFNHSFANPLIDDARNELEGPARRLYDTAAEAMRELSYGSWESMAYESLVRAAVIRYVDSVEGPQAAQDEMRAEVDAGFAWIPDLVELLSEYERSRDRYPTMESFMPRVVDLFRGLEGGF